MIANKKLIATLVTALAATGAFAQQTADTQPRGKTRAEVRAELEQARAEGQVLPVFEGEASAAPNATPKAVAKKREDSKRESALRPAAPVGTGG
ncbi:DUF4148 domain-containing protein [Caldimonas brevitalea]|uniref:DUF4148 domain-containing protein n=1 Tax=Caldimonas brevitalea TaxID=413882 RepID=A0A0G3BIG2_9BURK|nr:DUF4148 domain-containing protein [Caldimonas brevitalea]AKJ29157.1 hypothetical protein AAW51_2466 [Caldimonas brevitalea]